MPISKVICDKCEKEIDYCEKEIDYNDSHDLHDNIFYCKRCYLENILEDKIIRLNVVINKESNFNNEKRILEKEIVNLKKEIKEIDNERQ